MMPCPCRDGRSRPFQAALLASAARALVVVAIMLGVKIEDRQALANAEATLAATAAVSAKAPSPTVEFTRDIRPILSENCFHCHGPDALTREAALRLDVREGVLGAGDAPGVVVPQRPDESELFRRITAADDAGRMPPPDARDRLSPAQVERIGQWIAGGAKWQPHWAFVAPERPALPPVKDTARVRNPIDRFVLARLEQHGLAPSPEADAATLIRRVTLDLTGLPPTLEEVDAYLADTRNDAYERLVERLLDSPRYGERMATPWLNAARFADTYGYQDDNELSMWRWRDWVIEAFNNNMPFDQFTIEQLAGDLLPDPTFAQQLATGFNRNHRANAEGGAIPEEFRTEAVVDRTDTTATVWLGLTMVCARCHDHKYDPLSQREFYQFFAFFNNVPEDGRARSQGNTPPLLLAPTRRDRARQAEAESELRAARQALRQMEPQIAAAQAEWEASGQLSASEDFLIERELEFHFPFDGAADDARGGAGEPRAVGGPARYGRGKLGQALALDGSYHVDFGDVADYSARNKFTIAAWIRPEPDCDGSIVSRIDERSPRRGFNVFIRDGRLRVHLDAQWLDDGIRLESIEPVPANAWTHVAVSVDGSQIASGVQVYFNGVKQPVRVELDALFQTTSADGPLRIGSAGEDSGRFIGRIDDVRFYRDELRPQQIESLATPSSIAHIAGRPAEQRSAAEARKLRQYFLMAQAPPELMAAASRVAAAQQTLQEVEESFPDVMVMRERSERRPTHVLFRGLYDQPREQVEPGVPAVLPPLAADGPRNRLGLARWLVDPQHPLTARVTVNRIWQMSFGTGLVKTAEDFGSQGEPPSHPLLLDWLAREFVDGGWNVKEIRRLIVTSATYRQSSQVTPKLLAVDPENRLLARGPRFRLPAEMLRDQALFASGLLVEQIGGPSVRPYQPAGLWEELSNDEYEQDHGQRLYRRSLYTFWKRTIPFPALALFDAPNREACQVREERTNTPLQALTLLNETAFVEAARFLAERVLPEAGPAQEERLAHAFRLVTCRPPDEDERDILKDAVRRHLAHYQRHPAEAVKLLSVGESPRDESLDAAELAAYTAIANMLLNLDEASTQH